MFGGTSAGDVSAFAGLTGLKQLYLHYCKNLQGNSRVGVAMVSFCYTIPPGGILQTYAHSQLSLYVFVRNS